MKNKIDSWITAFWCFAILICIGFIFGLYKAGEWLVNLIN